MESMTSVTGWFSANPCSQPGMLAIGTKAELMKVSGNTQMSPNACTDSSSLIVRPM